MYPRAGDVEGWNAWFREKNAGCTEEQVTEGVLRIFEADVWYQRSNLRRMLQQRAQAEHILQARTNLSQTLAFLKLDTRSHRDFKFKQFRQDLWRRRVMYDIHNGYESPNPYDEIEMEITRRTS